MNRRGTIGFDPSPYPIIQGEKNWKFLQPVAPVILRPSTFWGHSLLAHAARQHVISVSYSTKPVHNKTTTGIQLSNIMPIKTNTTNIEDYYRILKLNIVITLSFLSSKEMRTSPTIWGECRRFNGVSGC